MSVRFAFGRPDRGSRSPTPALGALNFMRATLDLILVVVFLGGCASREQRLADLVDLLSRQADPNYEHVRVQSYTPDGRRRDYRGFSILPPQEKGWKILNGDPENVFLIRQASKGSHAMTLLLQTQHLQEPATNLEVFAASQRQAIDDALEKFGSLEYLPKALVFGDLSYEIKAPRKKDRRFSRFKRRSVAVTPESSISPLCVRYEIVLEEACPSPEQHDPILMTCTGYAIAHPDDPRTMIRASYSFETREGGASARMIAEAKQFLDNFRIEPIQK